MRWAKWGVVAIVGLGLAIWVATSVFRTQLGERAFKRAASEALQRDLIGSLPDGLHVLLVGTGSPMADPSRMGPSTAVIAGDRIFIVDAGSGSPRNLGRFGVPIGAVEAVLLTHFHSDHIDSLGELLLQRWAGGARQAPVPVYGPDGVGEVVDGFNAAYRLDQGYRVAHHGSEVVPPSGFGGTAISFTAAPQAVVLDEGGLTITAFAVDHDPVMPAVGYRFDYKGRSLTLSGDTAPTPSLVTAARETDILVSEALNTDMVGVLEAGLAARGAANLAAIMADIPGYHTTPVQAAEMAADADARLLVFSHIVPAVPTPILDAYFTRGTGEVFDGDVIVGQDGMLFSLPAEGTAIARRRLD